MNPQIHALRAKPHIIVATPGRLVDHLQQRTVELSRVSVLVLDELEKAGYLKRLDHKARHFQVQGCDMRLWFEDSPQGQEMAEILASLERPILEEVSR